MNSSLEKPVLWAGEGRGTRKIRIRRKKKMRKHVFLFNGNLLLFPKVNGN